MDKTLINKERRKRQAEDRLGDRHPVCIACGENNPLCLEKHHVGGRKFDESLAILCRNCHRKQSDEQLDHPKPLSEQPSQLEKIGHVLLGLADLFLLLAEKLKEFGKYLINEAEKQIGKVVQ